MTSNLTARTLIILLAIGLCILAIKKFEVNWGIDLRGGSILTYQVVPPDDDTLKPAEVDDVVLVVAERINQEGLKDIAVQRQGEDQLVITLPGMTPAQAALVQDRMTQLGELMMPVGAQQGDRSLNGVAFNQQTFDTQWREHQKALVSGQRPTWSPPPEFRWFPTRPEREKNQTKASYDTVIGNYKRQLIEEPWEVAGDWFYFDPVFWSPEGGNGFTGEDIENPRRSYDERGNLAAGYDMRVDRQNAFAAYTSKFKGRPMALILNREIWSAPTINSTLKDNVQIYNGSIGFSQEEQSWLINCLQSGSLKLQPRLLSKQEIDATLGEESINRATLAFGLGLALVAGFMLFYYRAAGILAIIALVVNGVLIAGILMLLDVSFTLPGIAGLILTVGMAVDANILIYERIREELGKGKTLVHAAKNGYDRAFITIFDANLTTFIVAAFLVYYGKGPIKGFGYTLMTGIVCTMFSAIFVTRTVMGWLIKKKWITDLKMMRILTAPNVQFLAKVKTAAMGSALLIAVGFVAFFMTGRDKYGLDFNGGTSASLQFRDAVAEAEVRDAVRSMKAEGGGTRFDEIKVTGLNPVDGKSKQYTIVLGETGADAEASDGSAVIRNDLQSTFGDKLQPEELTAVEYSSETGGWGATLNLTERFEDSDAINRAVAGVGLANVRVNSLNAEKTRWRIEGNVSEGARRQAEAGVRSALSEVDGLALSNPIPAMRFLGPRVVSGLKAAALQSIIVSLIFILLYIWLRFKELKYGFAAALALVHDVMISLGVIVMANASGIVDVKISLEIIAAFLTIIGYSLNDTIVVFDRVRENVHNMRGSFREIVNRSINQTLARTILTSVTTFFVVLSIFLFNYGIESPIEGFAFTLLVGVVVGTYSSIFVASPFLVYLNDREQSDAAKAKASKAAAKAATA